MQQVPSDAVQEVPVVEVFAEALRHVRAWFRNALNQKLLKEYVEHVAFSFSYEPQVCHFLTIRIRSVLPYLSGMVVSLMALCWEL